MRKGGFLIPDHIPRASTAPFVMAGLVPAIHALVSWLKTWMPGTRPGMTEDSPRGKAQLLLQLPLQDLDFLGQRHVVADQALDLAHRVQHRGVVAAAEAPADFR